MVQLIQIGNSANTPHKRYVCDSVADIELIEHIFGNMAICLDENEDARGIYMCNSANQYVKVA